MSRLVLSICVAAICGHVSANQAEPVVQLNQSSLIGRAIPTLGQEFFAGIPFAEPPLGDLRLAPPILKFSPYNATFNATEFGPSCPQGNADDSEDCLTINILRPAGIDENASLPVMVWIFGGGFFEGKASKFNASAVVAQSTFRGTPVIYVNFNYRLGPLGFPIGNEVEARCAQNLGLKDQLAALQWIQANIGTFGGDKTKVTVFGESAGAISIGLLMLDPSFGNLARAAILESGSGGTSALFPASAGETVWQSFVSAIPECASGLSNSTSNDTFACVRAANLSSILSAEIIAAASAQFAFLPALDGPDGLIPDLPSNLWKQGRFAKIPFIAGTNQDEGTSFVPSSFNSTDQLRDWIIANHTPPATSISPQTVDPALASTADALLQLYPDVPACGSPFNTGNETFGLNSQYKRGAALTSDIAFQGQRRAWIGAAAAQGVSTFGYLFTDPQPQLDPALGITHGTEVPYVYGGVPRNASASSLTLSRNMIDYWVSFVTSLDPNDGKGNASRPCWDAYTPQNQEILELNGAMTAMIPDTYRHQQVSYIQSIAAVLNT